MGGKVKRGERKQAEREQAERRQRKHRIFGSRYAVSYMAQVETRLGEGGAEKIARTAERIFDDLTERYPDLLDGEKAHAYSNIFPAIALYKSLQAHDIGSAMEILEQGAAAVAREKGRTYAAVVRLPGMKRIFLKLFSLGVKKSFGESSGFRHEILVKNGKAFEFNITECPYRKYCVAEGCPELVHIFCKNDEYAYGNLPGIRFDRTKTLGTGGDACDFKFRRG